MAAGRQVQKRREKGARRGVDKKKRREKGKVREREGKGGEGVRERRGREWPAARGRSPAAK